MEKQYAVIGLGRFGESISVELENLGCSVIVIDQQESRVEPLKDKVSYAMVADVEDSEVFKSIDIKNLDGVIISIVNNMEASIMATMSAIEQGAKFVMAVAKNKRHAKVLGKIGADSVIFPEKEIGALTARRLMSLNFANWIELSKEYSLIERATPTSWVGKTIRELNIRKVYSVNVVGYKLGEKVEINPEPDQPLTKDMLLIMIGANRCLDNIK